MARLVTRGYGANGGNSIVVRGYGITGTPFPPASLGLHSPFYDLTLPGIRWANAPRGRPQFVMRQGTRVEHINTVMNIAMSPSDRENETFSGVIRFRTSHIPAIVKSLEGRNLDQFGNVIYPDMTVSFPPGHIQDANAVALWRVDEIFTTDNLTDKVGAYPIREFGTPKVVPGKVRYARATDSTHYFQGVGNAALGTCFSGSWTVEQWVRPDFHPAASNIFIYNGLNFSSDNNHTIMAEIQYNAAASGRQGNILVHQWQSPGALTTITGSIQLQSGSWYHIAVSRQDDGTNSNKFNYSIYVNGVRDTVMSGVSGIGFPISGSGHFVGFGNFIGASGMGTSPGNPFYGNMDELRISNIVRSGSEIQTSYLRGF